MTHQLEAATLFIFIIQDWKRVGHPFFLGTFPICLQTFTVQLGNYSGELTLILTCLITIALRTQSLQPQSRVNLRIVSYEFKCFSQIISGERWNLDTNPYLALNVVIWKLSKIRDFSKLIRTRKVTSTYTNHSCSYQFSFISIISFWIPPSEGRLLWNCLRQNVSKSITIFFSFWNLNWSYKVLRLKNWCSQFFLKNYHFGDKPQIPPK